MRRIFFILVAFALVFASAASSGGQRVRAEHPSTDPNAVLYWSQVAESTIAVGRPPASSEVLNGVVHAAIYDATVSVDHRARAQGIAVAPSTAPAPKQPSKTP